ncbi:MAG: 4-hydroxybenzoate octaprenyltransferase [Deltaproteobacteria bacterium]|nr:4-hydroxybenzoate octaprenyltransferase [Deltaproteobacteria bacterium]
MSISAIKRYASLVALPHTIFSLPFALGAAAIAGEKAHPPLSRYAWIVLAVASARTAAMSFNRYADREIDAKNPRTKGREIPRGAVSPQGALALCAVASALFVVTAWRLGPLPLALSPIALAVCLGYSLAKRFTSLPHLILGLALAGAPCGAWIAITGGFGWAPLALSLAVAAWVAGFDLIYACQDAGFDRAHGVGSVAARWGIPAALKLSSALHMATSAGLLLFGVLLNLGIAYYVGTFAIVVTLAYEHAIVSPGDLTRVNRAFFDLNGYVSLIFGACAVVEALT